MAFAHLVMVVEKQRFVQSDVWSLGCILYEMMTFRHPFNGRNTTELYRQVSITGLKAVSGLTLASSLQL